MSNYIVKKFMTRPVYSAKRLKEHEINRVRLLNEFHAQGVTFRTEDNIALSGLLLIREGARKNVIVCHGYRMAKERMMNFASILSTDNILLFDFRAHGQSEGTSTTLGFDEKKDIAAALSFLQQHEKTKQLPTFGIGVSMGAVSLLAAACEGHALKGLVLDSAFTCLDEQAHRILTTRYNLPRFPFEPIGKMMFKYRMHFSPEQVNTLVWAQQIKIPVLIVHSKYDDTAPWADAQKVYELIQGQKELWLVDGSGHARVFDDCCDEYQKRLEAFFNSILI